MLFANSSETGAHPGTMERTGQSSIKSKIVTFETLAMKHMADNMLELLAADEVLNEKDRKIGGALPWEEMANLKG